MSHIKVIIRNDIFTGWTWTAVDDDLGEIIARGVTRETREAASRDARRVLLGAMHGGIVTFVGAPEPDYSAIAEGHHEDGAA